MWLRNFQDVMPAAYTTLPHHMPRGNKALQFSDTSPNVLCPKHKAHTWRCEPKAKTIYAQGLVECSEHRDGSLTQFRIWFTDRAIKNVWHLEPTKKKCFAFTQLFKFIWFSWSGREAYVAICVLDAAGQTLSFLPSSSWPWSYFSPTRFIWKYRDRCLTCDIFTRPQLMPRFTHVIFTFEMFLQAFASRVCSMHRRSLRSANKKKKVGTLARPISINMKYSN